MSNEERLIQWLKIILGIIALIILGIHIYAN